jgi:hypothetical protein
MLPSLKMFNDQNVAKLAKRLEESWMMTMRAILQ